MAITARDAAHTLKARELAAQGERLARESQARDAVLRIVASFLGPGERVWLIGSLAWGGFGARSDVDLVISGLSAERALELETLVARIASAPVELLALEDLPQAFRQRVEREGIALP